jgi:hypothetical protein
MSYDQIGKTTRRDFLGTATAATALTLGASQGAQAQAAPIKSDEVQLAQLTTAQAAAPPTARGPSDWTKPAAMAIPKEGYFNLEQGRYGPMYPRTPANYGFTIIAKVKAGRENVVRAYGKTIEEGIKNDPALLAALKLHYLRWVLFDVGSGLHFMYQGIFDTDFDKYLEDAVAAFEKSGVTTVFENLEGFPENWRGNVPAWNKYFREHQCPSFLEYAEYPYVSADEVKKALRVKAALSGMLDQMQ